MASVKTRARRMGESFRVPKPRPVVAVIRGPRPLVAALRLIQRRFDLIDQPADSCRELAQAGSLLPLVAAAGGGDSLVEAIDVGLQPTDDALHRDGKPAAIDSARPRQRIVDR